MKIAFFTCLLILSITLIGQKNPTQQAQPIVKEGKQLYKSEMASWYGTDLFIEKYKNSEKVGGYFSYTRNDTSKCIFFSDADIPKVLGEVSFDSTYNLNNARIDFTPRVFTPAEKVLYTIRKIALAEIKTDTLFKVYKNTNLNLIPIINGDEKKVYILSGTNQNDVVIFGNDYLITFDKDNSILHKKKLHNNIIPIYYGAKAEHDLHIKGTIHSHSKETGNFITANDICTLMLYEELAGWNEHNVISEKYINIWNCKTDELLVVPTKMK